MGRGREETLVKDFNTVAKENDELRAMVGQLQGAYTQLQARLQDARVRHDTISKFFSASILEAEGQRVRVKHRTITNLPAAFDIYKREVDDVWVEFEVILTAERMEEVQREIASLAGDGDAESPAGDGDAMVREEADGGGVADGGGLVDEFGAPVPTDPAA